MNTLINQKVFVAAPSRQLAEHFFRYDLQRKDGLSMLKCVQRSEDIRGMRPAPGQPKPVIYIPYRLWAVRDYAILGAIASMAQLMDFEIKVVS